MIALPVSALDLRWSSSLNVNDWQTVVVSTNGGVYDTEGNVQPGGCSLELSPFGVEDGPWVLALHGFKPTWKGEDAPAEIHLVGYGRAFDPQWTKKLLSYRLQLSRVSTSADTQVAEKPQKSRKLFPNWTGLNSEPEHPKLEAMCGEWKLSLVEQACAPASTVPWNPSCIANSGHIITSHDQAYCFKLFRNGEQPHTTVDLGMELDPGMEPTLASVEPWSGSLVIGTPGKVRILKFD